MSFPNTNLETLHKQSGQAPPPARSASAKSRSHWLIWLIVIVAILIGGYLVVEHFRSVAESREAQTEKAQASRAIPVVAAASQRGDLPIYLDALGLVTPLNVVSIHTRVDGQIEKIAFTEGQIVQAGDLLAQIDPRPFQVQLAQAQAQLAKDQAALRDAQIELQRDREAGAAIAKQQVDTQAATVDQDEAATKIDQAMIDNAKLQLDYCRITAPISGVIGLRQVDQGNIVHATDATGLAVITQIQPITVVFSISEDQIPAVLNQQRDGAKFLAEAYDRSLTHQLASGTLSAIDNQVDPSTGMIKLKAQFANDPKMLFPNQFVNVRLLIDTVKSAVIIPSAAVQRGPDFVFVYVIKSDQTVEVRKVSLGATEGDETVVESGVSPGEIVVTDGVDKLQAGSKVQVKKPATKPSTTQRSTAGTRPSSRPTEDQP